MALLYSNIGGMRKPYNRPEEVFTESDLVAKDPIKQFGAWFDEACKTEASEEVNAVCLATASKEGVPSNRYVLLKGYGKEGFFFYTKYTSRKGRELLENPKASLCFYWEPLKRSIRIEGDVSKLPESASDDYFSTRPKESQIAAYISCQTPEVVANRSEIMQYFKEAQEKFKDKPVPRPKDWGGYVVVPNYFEFWHGQSNRTHDRITFRRRRENEVLDPKITTEGEDGWLIERIAP